MSLAQYSFLHKDSKTNAGGVALYVKRKIEFSVKDKIHFNINGCKDLWIEIKQNLGKKIIVGVIYRHPKYNFQEFQNCLNNAIMNFENSM